MSKTPSKAKPPHTPALPYTQFTPVDAYLHICRLYSQFPWLERETATLPMPHWYKEALPTLTDEQHEALIPWISDASSKGKDQVVIQYSRSRAVAISALFSMFCSGMIRGRRMGYIFTANLHGSGKTLLAQIPITTIAGWTRFESLKEDDEKMRTALDAAARSGVSHLLFDNVKPYHQIASPVLEAFITAPQWSGREFHTNDKLFLVTVACTVFVTGNNTNPNPDLARRLLQAELFVSEGDVQDRVIDRESYLDDDTLASPKFRNDLLGAVWTLVNAWQQGGAPKATTNLRQGFVQWCELIGGIMLHSGFGSPLIPAPTSNSLAGGEEVMALKLITRIAEKTTEKGALRADLKLDEVIQILYDNDLWGWLLKGKEENEIVLGTPIPIFRAEHGCKVSIGQRLAKYAPHRTPEQQRNMRVYKLGPDLGVWAVYSEHTGPCKRFIFERASA